MQSQLPPLAGYLRHPRAGLIPVYQQDPFSANTVVCRQPSTPLPPIVLIQQWFDHPQPIRAAEFTACLQQNIANSRITRIVMLKEKDTDGAEIGELRAAAGRVECFTIGRRMRFHDALQWASRAGLVDGTIVIIANLDIYFDATLAALNTITMSGRCLALLRHDEQRDGKRILFGPRNDSQDAWMVQMPLLPLPGLDTDTSSFDFVLGYPGCDNAIAYEFATHGYEVINPCHDICAIHIHNTAIRNYDITNLQLRTGYMHVPPVRISTP